MLGKPKTDLSKYTDIQKKAINQLKSFRETGYFTEWESRLSQEMHPRSVTWLPDGTALLASDGFSITKIDISGNKFPIYSAKDQSMIFGNVFCRANGDISFVEVKPDWNAGKSVSALVRLNTEGEVLSKTQGVSSNSKCPFDTQPAFPLVGERKIAVTANEPENMHDAYLRTSSLSPNLNDWKETVDWKDHMKTYDIHDPNRVQFYYVPKAFINNEDEVLLFKRRAQGIRKPKDYPNWEATPYTAENASAPWVELRKMKIS